MKVARPHKFGIKVHYNWIWRWGMFIQKCCNDIIW